MTCPNLPARCGSGGADRSRPFLSLSRRGHVAAVCRMQYGRVHTSTTCDVHWGHGESAVQEMGASAVAYSPLGRARRPTCLTPPYLLSEPHATGLTTFCRPYHRALHIAQLEGLRRWAVRVFSLPRFSEENLVYKFRAVAAKYGATPEPVVALVPIPGSRSAARVEETAKAAEIVLDGEEVEMFRAAVAAADVQGTRYPPECLARTAPDSLRVGGQLLVAGPMREPI
ncbi:hypothetical protein DAEQUDRAFT_370224 [Daedalea quercina L-15889]|uniref:Uncharacterized protein n=1 Tax=Daedalea quercina L-15889 TaxID=1314783 RepID=A0A165PAX7_9APHY|nr:hypothetical protein DAEQUDRAFT_370224 [Daedalea quercina L-15889]